MKNRAMSLTMPLLFGILGLLFLLDHRLGAIRLVDLIHVLGAGMCFGVALALSVTKLRKPPAE
jgi:cyanate permease